MKQLHDDLAYWKRQLRLDDLDITLRWMAQHERDGDVGVHYPEPLCHRHVIAVRHPDHLSTFEKKEFSADYEVILVHEVLHCRENRWKETQEMREALENELVQHNYEISLDAIAEALVRARRGITR
jgi:hypothetical protein